jgi:glycosyltransferase involved in cell wall biosynthesis
VTERVPLSIVTCVRNSAGTIRDAVESVLNQSFRDFEYIIQDGGSTDGTLAYLESLNDPRIRLRSEPDAGIYDGINKGIGRAEGETIGLLHADDMLASRDTFAQIIATMDESPAAGGCYGDLVYVRKSAPDQVVRYWRAGLYTPGRLRRGWMPPHPTVYLRRSVFEQFGTYDSTMRIAADYEAMLRLLLRNKVQLAYLPVVMVRMRLGGESNRSLSRIALKMREDLDAIRRNQAGGVGTLMLKSLRKLLQFIRKPPG